MCKKLIFFPILFEENFLNNFLELANDKVISVRISQAKVLAKIFKIENLLSKNISIKKLAN